MVFQNIKQCLPPLLRRQPIQAKSPAKENNPDGKTVQNETLAAHISHPEYPLTTMTVPVDIVIVGGGIVGLVLALALHHHGVCRHVQVFEQAPAFHEDVGESASGHG
jgi:NADPH-dependent 2,4-dienoyl-CoA reductase/sulfur reductase-like enzyme